MSSRTQKMSAEINLKMKKQNWKSSSYFESSETKWTGQLFKHNCAKRLKIVFFYSLRLVSRSTRLTTAVAASWWSMPSPSKSSPTSVLHSSPSATCTSWVSSPSYRAASASNDSTLIRQKLYRLCEHFFPKYAHSETLLRKE